jgi:maltose O-acetyltransferase
MEVPDLAEVRRTLRKVQKLRQRLRGEVDIEALVELGLQIGSNVYVAHDATSREALGYTRLAPVNIGSRVFLGADTLVLPGVTIGDDSVIGAGSLVSSDIPAGSLAVGRPARVVGDSHEFFERRKAQIDASPKFTLSDAATPEGRARIRRQIEQTGEGYIP